MLLGDVYRLEIHPEYRRHFCLAFSRMIQAVHLIQNCLYFEVIVKFDVF